MITRIPDREVFLRACHGRVMLVNEALYHRTFPVSTNRSGSRRVRVLGKRVSSYLGPSSEKVIGGNQISVIDIFGPLTHRGNWWGIEYDNYDTIGDRLVEELTCPDVAAIVLHMDSPGGDVCGLEDTIAQIVKVRDHVCKPIAVHVDELCASAAYWLASTVANAGIFSTKAGEIGSIGAYTPIWDHHEQLAKEGINVVMVRVPDGKNADDPSAPLLDIAVQRATESVKEVADRFFAAVELSRNISLADVRSFDAKLYSAPKSVELKLIDGIGSLEDAILAINGYAIANKSGSSNKEANVKFTGIRAVDKSMLEMETGKSGIVASVKKAEESTADAVAPVSNDDGGGGTDVKGKFEAVATIASECAAACTEAANAISGGLPAEAIDAIGKMATACRSVIEKTDSLFEKASGGVPTETTTVQEPALSAMDAISKQLCVQAMEVDIANRKLALDNKQASDATKKYMLTLPKSQFDEIFKCLPDKYNGELAAHVTVSGVRTPSSSIMQMTKAQMLAAKRMGVDPDLYANVLRKAYPNNIDQVRM